MYIHEAIAETTAERPYITRRAWESRTYKGPGPAVKMDATDSPDRCVVHSVNRSPLCRWQPSKADLTADDWEPVR